MPKRTDIKKFIHTHPIYFNITVNRKIFGVMCISGRNIIYVSNTRTGKPIDHPLQEYIDRDFNIEEICFSELLIKEVCKRERILHKLSDKLDTICIVTSLGNISIKEKK